MHADCVSSCSRLFRASHTHCVYGTEIRDVRDRLESLGALLWTPQTSAEAFGRTARYSRENMCKRWRKYPSAVFYGTIGDVIGCTLSVK